MTGELVEQKHCTVNATGATDGEPAVLLRGEHPLDPLLHGDARRSTTTEGRAVVSGNLRERVNGEACETMDEPTDPEFECIMARINELTRRLAADLGQTEVELLLGLADEYEHMADYLERRIDVKPHYEEAAEVNRTLAHSIREIFRDSEPADPVASDSTPPRDRLH